MFIIGLMQERRNSSANALELGLSGANPTMFSQMNALSLIEVL